MGILLTPDEIRRQLVGQIHCLYDLPEDIKVHHLKYSENFTYCLESEREKKKYVLRVNRPGYHSLEELKGELLWMKALRRDTDLLMADVLSGSDGEYIQRLVFDSSEDYVCTLFSFVEGEGIRGMEPERLISYQRKIGAITAKLHLHSMSWNKDQHLPRFHWDLEDLFGEGARWGDWSLNTELTPEQRELFGQTVEIGRGRLLDYGKSSDRYGLIHSDLNINNILIQGDQVKVLDFDDCGYGWFLYDLSTAVLEYDDTLEEMIQAWLEGYETVRLLSEKDKAEIDTFVILRKIVRMGWIATHSDNDTVKRVTSRYYEETEKLAEKYVNQNE